MIIIELNHPSVYSSKIWKPNKMMMQQLVIIPSQLQYIPINYIILQQYYLDNWIMLHHRVCDKALRDSLICDIHPVVLRTLSLPTVYGETGTRSTGPQNSAAFILHRFGVECRSKSKISLMCEPVGDNKVSALLRKLYNTVIFIHF